MEADFVDWINDAFEIYRLARQAIERFKGTIPDDTHLDFCIEELKEELLDLKQATIAKDSAAVAEATKEIALLLIEIQLHLEGNP